MYTECSPVHVVFFFVLLYDYLFDNDDRTIRFDCTIVNDPDWGLSRPMVKRFFSGKIILKRNRKISKKRQNPRIHGVK